VQRDNGGDTQYCQAIAAVPEEKSILRLQLRNREWERPYPLDGDIDQEHSGADD